MENQLLVIIAIFFAVNFVAFLVMLLDKVKSRKNGAERISEGFLFFMAAAMGSVGVYAGMFAFRHKTQKWHFLIGIPLLMLQNGALCYLVYLFLI